MKHHLPRIKKIAYLTLLVVFLTYSFNTFINNYISKIRISQSQMIKKSSENLGKTVQSALEGSQGDYAVVIKNLKTDEFYYLNEDKEYQPGSLYKIWVMAETFRQIQTGTLKEDEVLSKDIKDLNKEFNIDPEYAELKDGSITQSVNEALKQMVTISHNYSALLLTQKIKISNIKQFLVNNNFKNSDIGQPPKTTPSDIVLFFEKLYKGELANPENTQKMLDLLKSQKLNHKLPKVLPTGVPIAHKTGEIDYLSHDAGIVYSDKGDYIIVIFSETQFPAAANDRIAQISKAVYEYFQK